MKVKLIVEGGKMQPGPSVAQQLGPMGVNLGKVISDVNEATKSFSGIKVPVEIDVNSKTKKFKIEVFSPPVSELIKKEIGIDKGSGLPATIKVGNVAIETLLGIAKTKMPNLLAKDLKSALSLIVGSCVSLGVLIDNKEAKEIQKEIESGNFDNIILKEVTSPTEEKKAELEKFFKDRKDVQDKEIKAKEDAKAVEEAEAAKKAEKSPDDKSKPSTEIEKKVEKPDSKVEKGKKK